MRLQAAVLSPLSFFAAILLAAINAASLSWPVEWIFAYGEPVWTLHLLSLVGFYKLLAKNWVPRQRCLIACTFVTTNLTCIFGWLFTAMHTYGGLDAWMAVAALIGLAAALSIYYGLAAAIHVRFEHTTPFVQTATFTVLWTGAELARGTWLTGFGWGAPGYAHTSGPLAVYAPYVGAYGVGAIAIWIAATLASPLKVSRLQVVCAISVLLAAVPLKSVEWTQQAGKVSVNLLQGNIAQSEKFEESTGVPAALAWYAKNILSSSAQLTVAPETAIPLLPQELPAAYWAPIRDKFSQPGVALMTGIPLGDYQTGYTNSVIALSDKPAADYHYAKHHLVPFGEFIPPFFRWFTTMMNIPLGDFNRGAVGQPSFNFANQRLAPNICYEDLFGEELGARFIDPSQAPTIFVNVSNLGWFGGGLVIDQHLQISRMRALEFERPFVRATNTGATAVMNHKAQVTASLPRMTQGVLQGTVEGRIGTTPFAWWVSRAGLWPYWIAILLVLALAWRSRSKPL